MGYYDHVFYREFVALNTSMLVLSTASVLLRYLARRKKQASLKGDDLWALVSLISFWAYASAGFYGLFNGGGLSPYSLPLPILVNSLKATYAAAILCLFTITSAKLSILLLYRRVFLVDKGFRRVSTVIVSFISIIRIKLTLHELGQKNQGRSSGNWITAQLGFAVICCCLPTYRPLLPPSKKITDGAAAAYHSMSSLISTRHGPGLGPGYTKTLATTARSTQCVRLLELEREKWIIPFIRSTLPSPLISFESRSICQLLFDKWFAAVDQLSAKKNGQSLASTDFVID
ncbi:MAG: hypothetical protein Q9220_006210 [cf. Caloplaca sp. 1 TL-2023]